MKVIKMSNISTLQWQNLWTQIYKHLYKQPLWQNMCLCFAMWTKAKWAFGWWCNDLVDEELRGFGLVESAKTMDWSSWGFEGASIFLLCVFYFLVLFLFASDEFYFVFFMEWVTIDIDQHGMCVVFRRDAWLKTMDGKYKAELPIWKS